MLFKNKYLQVFTVRLIKAAASEKQNTDARNSTCKYRRHAKGAPLNTPPAVSWIPKFRRGGQTWVEGLTASCRKLDFTSNLKPRHYLNIVTCASGWNDTWGSSIHRWAVTPKGMLKMSRPQSQPDDLQMAVTNHSCIWYRLSNFST